MQRSTRGGVLGQVLTILRRVPGYSRTREAILGSVAGTREAITVVLYRLPHRNLRPSGKADGVVVSLTSFPDRIAHVWVTVESILRQSHVPDRVVLVLADTQFPGRVLPRSLQRQCQRGLEILWTDRDIRSYKKLLPTAQAFPDAIIITVDDDVVYHRSFVKRLVEESNRHPRAVIGYHGWQIVPSPEGLEPYITWPRATADTPSSRLLLVGAGGILYPRHGLPVDLLCDFDLATHLCPSGDDLWFWAVSRKAGLGIRCLGLLAHTNLRRQASSPTLESVNRTGGENDRMLARVISHFGFSIS